MILVSALLLQATASPPVTSAAPQQQAEQVVVVGRNPDDTGAALNNCMARHCPPEQDIAAAVTHATAQFAAGDLDGARRTLHQARARNKRYAKALPVQVSGLLAFDADVAGLSGYADWDRIGTIDSVSALRAGLSADDPRIAQQRMSVANVFARQGRFYLAVAMYDRIAQQATLAHWPMVPGLAMFRAAMLYSVAASFDPAFAQEAGHRITAVQQTSEPELQPFRDGTVALRARIAGLAGRRKDLEAALTDAQTVRASEAVLVYTPRFDLRSAPGGSSGVGYAYDTRDQWVDVSFRIAPDGTVRDVSTSRSGKGVEPDWVKKVEEVVAGRRYLPLALAADAPGLTRLERFMLVSDMSASTRSRIRRPVGVPRVETVDLTPSQHEATPPAAAGDSAPQ